MNLFVDSVTNNKKNDYDDKLIEPQAKDDLLFIGFNQDNKCFTICTNNGFIIFNVNPFVEIIRRIFNDGIGQIEMLFHCNIMAIVGGGSNPRYPKNKVMLWDDLQNKCIAELMFKQDVKAVKLRRDRIVVVLLSKVYIYRFKDLKLLDQITTISNPKSIIALTSNKYNNVLAIPYNTKGAIRIELYDIGKTSIIYGHDAELVCIALNNDGTLLASASEKGTLIRLWNCNSGEIIKEFRRGMDRAEIYCLCFNQLSTLLACSSDKGTIHIFSLNSNHINVGDINSLSSSISNQAINYKNNNNFNESESYICDEFGKTPSNFFYNDNKSSKLNDINISQNNFNQNQSNIIPSITGAASHMHVSTPNKSLALPLLRQIIPTSMVPKYLNSEWSFAQIRGIEGKSICCFDKNKNTIYVACSDKSFIACPIEESGGECKYTKEKIFI